MFFEVGEVFMFLESKVRFIFLYFLCDKLGDIIGFVFFGVIVRFKVFCGRVVGGWFDLIFCGLKLKVLFLVCVFGGSEGNWLVGVFCI